MVDGISKSELTAFNPVNFLHQFIQIYAGHTAACAVRSVVNAVRLRK